MHHHYNRLTCVLLRIRIPHSRYTYAAPSLSTVTKHNGRTELDGQDARPETRLLDGAYRCGARTDSRLDTSERRMNYMGSGEWMYVTLAGFLMYRPLTVLILVL